MMIPKAVKVKDLPLYLRKLVKKRWRQDLARLHGITPSKENWKKILEDSVSGAFTWSRTPEGHGWWMDIEWGRYPHTKKKARIMNKKN